MRVGIITFHASHNYGSMLQAYALQKTVESLGHECEIINFRTKRQKKEYRPFFFNRQFIKTAAWMFLYPRLTYTELLKHRLYENFLKENLIDDSKEYDDTKGIIKANLKFDAYISGSDQIWNTRCFDWDEAYGLGFVKSGKKIAYAPSMGPKPEYEVAGLSDESRKLLAMIKDYDAVSVREKRTADHIFNLTGLKFDTALDPTLLLDCNKWAELENEKPIIKGDYIFMYSPWEDYELMQKAIEYSSSLGLKLVISMHYGYREFHRRKNIIYKVATGPKEFLNLLRNAQLVIGASFHATAFSIIFHRQHYAYKGMEDSRVSSILNITGLTRFAEEPQTLLTPSELNKLYSSADTRLQEQRERSLRFLREALA